MTSQSNPPPSSWLAACRLAPAFSVRCGAAHVCCPPRRWHAAAARVRLPCLLCFLPRLLAYAACVRVRAGFTGRRGTTPPPTTGVQSGGCSQPLGSLSVPSARRRRTTRSQRSFIFSTLWRSSRCDKGAQILQTQQSLARAPQLGACSISWAQDWCLRSPRSVLLCPGHSALAHKARGWSSCGGTNGKAVADQTRSAARKCSIVEEEKMWGHR